ncbi:MAG: glycine cleavage system aminomethyltransferase GcvT [Actinomycetota bacterium]|nr:glycine cleavage system aminomethyltransferase GcvT [Actinomycetota bacterium]
MPEDRKATALLELHRRLGARLTEFSGWEMPLQYSGVIAEHRAVREAAGLFDVSHLGKLRIRGSDGGRALQHAVTADVTGLDVGRASYALVLTEDGGAVDDLFVYRIADEEWLVVPNAANVGAVASCIRASGGEPEDEWDRWTILALQGPRSFEKFDTAFPGTGALELTLHSWKFADLSGEQTMVARTGYTGEVGFELYVPSGAGVEIFTRLLDVGVAPVGLGARDTLRLEMGYALYGHELTREINPLEAKLGWAIDWAHDFRGRERVLEVKQTGARRTLVGVACSGRGIPRQGHEVHRDGAVVGAVTSGNFSPTLGTGIALALVEADAGVERGDRIEVAARERMIAGDIVKPPFIRKPRAQE